MMSKMKLIVLSVIGMVMMTAPYASANWCDLKTCRGAEHIDCKMYGKNFADECPDTAQMYNLSPHRDLIVNKMNYYRNKIAGGEIEGFEPATRMATLRYNNTLAILALRNVKQCEMKHDGCRNTPDFRLVGQNVIQAKFPDNITLTMHDVISQMIDAWWGQSELASQADIDKLGSGVPLEQIAYFTQIATMGTNRVGCGFVSFVEKEMMTVLFTCNFDLGNALDRPVYEKGAAASGCLSGTNPDYPNLCALTERYAVNFPFGELPKFDKIARRSFLKRINQNL